MSFTAADVKTLREMTSVGMMDCKKALTECDGDMDKAVEYLREKGLAKAAKKAGRIAAEGMSYALVENGVGALVEVNCETDFCAKSDLFVAFVKDIAKAVLDNDPADVDALMNCKYPGTELTVSETMPEKVMSIGENLQIRRFERFDNSTVNVAYNHMGGVIGVLVGLEVSEGLKDNATVKELGKDIGMQAAAMNPSFLDKSDVDQTTLDKEKEILLIQAKEDPKNANKPDAIKEKMAIGKLGKFYKENCLVDQEFVKAENHENVQTYINNVAKALGTEIKCTGFVRMMKGEGLEKREENFAEEIAKQING